MPKPDQRIRHFASTRNSTDTASATVVDGWQKHFEMLGVCANGMEPLSVIIDRPALRQQLQAVLQG